MLKNKKTAGLDRIGSEISKSGAPCLINSLTKLFNFLLSIEVYPDQGINIIHEIIKASVSLLHLFHLCYLLIFKITIYYIPLKLVSSMVSKQLTLSSP